jgi:nicotinate-nucleotide pyrophosphorylase (carboxylating)
VIGDPLPPPMVAAIERAGLDAADVERVARLALDEDLAGGVDVTTEATIAADQASVGDFVPRRAGVVAGIPVAMAVLGLVLGGRGSIDARVEDGADVTPGQVLLSVSGPTRNILTAERNALNLLCHLSGIATLTRQWVDAVAGTGAVVRDTRKTTPGLRALEKYAVRCGGGRNHRLALSDQALIKDNHVLAAGGIAQALSAVRARYPAIACEVECDTVAQVAEAVAAGAQLVLLDNMSLDETAESVRIARAAGVKTEASGGLRLESARSVAEQGVDFLAVGALTHSAPILDVGLDLRAG